MSNKVITELLDQVYVEHSKSVRECRYNTRIEFVNDLIKSLDDTEKMSHILHGFTNHQVNLVKRFIESFV